MSRALRLTKPCHPPEVDQTSTRKQTIKHVPSLVDHMSTMRLGG